MKELTERLHLQERSHETQTWKILMFCSPWGLVSQLGTLVRKKIINRENDI